MSEHATSILFVIRSLEIGGAQRQLAVQAIGLRNRGLRVAVAVFYPGGELQNELQRHGIPVYSLHKRSWADIAGFALRFIALVRRENPDVVYSFMPDANMFAAIFKPLWGTRVLLWGIRSSGTEAVKYNWRHRFVVAASIRLAECPDLWIANSAAGATHHVHLGYPESRMRIIPNGIDTDRFAPMTGQSACTRTTWQLSPGERTVGLIGRLDPIKNHGAFLDAIALLVAQGHAVRGVCVGRGSADYERTLRQRAEELGLDKRIEWIAEAPNMPDLYRSLDIVVSASLAEGFSNAIAEAMACGVPCVVTNVGDSAQIVGSAGRVVHPRDARALGQGIAELLAVGRDAAGEASRARIVANFGVSQMVDRTQQLLDELT